VSAFKDAWDTLRSVATVIDKVTELSDEMSALRAENRDSRDRVIRIETIIDEARRHATPKQVPPRR
jgi:hypothetical protein